MREGRRGKPAPLTGLSTAVERAVVTAAVSFSWWVESMLRGLKRWDSGRGGRGGREKGAA